MEKAGESFSGVKVNYDAKYKKALEVVKANYTAFEVPYYGLGNNDYVNGLGFCCNPSAADASSSSGSTGKMTAKNDNAELQQLYYHPDHLGSSSYINNLDGEVVQHIEYVPFGEVFLEEKNSKWNTPYLFNGKELDKETSLYYYGARYFDPKMSIWLSVDPLAVYNPVLEKEFYYDGDHNGGMYNSQNLNTYGYCYQNPVKFIDPNGKQVDFGILFEAQKIGIEATILYMAGSNCGGDCKSWFKSNYIGPSSSSLSAIEQRKTGVEPVDEVDLAAFNHDVAYDKIKAAGVKGAVYDLATLPADEKLLADSKQVLKNAGDRKKDKITGDNISLPTLARAKAVIRAFEPLVKQKQVRIATAKAAKNAAEKTKEILVEPIVCKE